MQQKERSDQGRGQESFKNYRSFLNVVSVAPENRYISA